MNNTDKTLGSLILEACQQLAKEGFDTFPLELIVVTVWSNHKEVFGMKGYEEKYPDLRKVLSVLCAKVGLVRRGYLVVSEICGRTHYSIGKPLVPFTSRSKAHKPKTVPVKKVIENSSILKRLSETVAVQKYPMRANALDACQFFGLKLVSQLRGNVPHQLTRQLEETAPGTVKEQSMRRICLDVARSLLKAHCRPARTTAEPADDEGVQDE